MIAIGSAFRVSLRALWVNKMRSALTMLGIVIGVAAVIAMLAVGNGATRMIGQQMASMGSNLLMVVPGSSTSGGVRFGAGTQTTLSTADAEAILRECPAVADVAPIHNGNAQIVYGHQNWSTQISGTTPGFLVVRDWSLSAGRPFSDQDVRNSGKVCILGQTVVDNLFGGEDPLGQVVRIKKIPFSVVGVLAPKGQAAFGQDQDDFVLVPVTTAQKRLFGTAFPGMVRMIMVKAKSEADLDPAQTQIESLLNQRHRIGPKADPDFTVRNLTQMMESAQQAAGVMSLLLGAIAGVSLLVGGIGIMNIMLVSVTERTREIGIRMAVGARTWDIRTQFLIEALTLSLMGGAIGIVLGSAGGAVINKTSGWPVAVSSLSVILAFGFSAAVGIFFGFYPAWKASRLNPIEALRYE
jgi:putative ABC transport system permease protein